MFEFIEPLVVAGELAAAVAVGALDAALHTAKLRGHARRQLAVFVRRNLAEPGDGGRRVEDEEIVFDRDEELRASRLSLARGAARELPIDARRFVTLEPDHMQAAEPQRFLRHGNVRAAAGHVRGDGDRARLARALDDARFLRILLGIEQPVGQAERREYFTKRLAVLDRPRADEHGLSASMAIGDLASDGGELRPLRGEHAVAKHRPLARAVARHDFRREPIAGAQLGCGLERRPAHAADAPIKSKIRRPRDRRLAAIFLGDLHAAKRLHRLMQSAAPAPIRAEPAGEFIDDHHLAVAHHVLHVAAQLKPRLQRRLDVVRPEATETRHHFVGEKFERLLFACGREGKAMSLRVALVVLASREPRGHFVGEPVNMRHGGRLLASGGNDQRAARLVDEHAVGLVDYGESVAALDEPRLGARAAEQHFVKARLSAARGPHRELIAQIVEAEFRADAIGHIARIRRALRRLFLFLGKQADRQPEPFERGPRKREVALGEIAVHRRDVRAESVQRETKRRHQRDQRLAFAGGHFREPAVGQDEPGEELAIVGHESVAPAHRLADQADRLGGMQWSDHSGTRLFAQRRAAFAEASIRVFTRSFRGLPRVLHRRCVAQGGAAFRLESKERVEAKHARRNAAYLPSRFPFSRCSCGRPWSSFPRTIFTFE